MKTYPDLAILIPAAGSGTRLGLGPKAWLELGGESLLSHLATKAKAVANEVIIAVPIGGVERMTELCPNCLIIEGKGSRQETVQALVDVSQSPWLLIQDVTRPFVSISLLCAVTDAAKETGAAGAFLTPDVPVAVINDGLVTAQFPAVNVGIFQAPQVFSRAILEQTRLAAEAGKWTAQSTMQLVLRAGYRVRSVPGEKTNIKLTTPDDWVLAQFLEELL